MEEARKGSLSEPLGPWKANAKGWGIGFSRKQMSERKVRLDRTARLLRPSCTCPRCGAPGGPYPYPGFIAVVPVERNFPLRPLLSFCLVVLLPVFLAARAWCQVAQKFTGGIGNKLCGECPARAGEGVEHGRSVASGSRGGNVTFSPPHPRQRSRGFLAGVGQGRGSRDRRRLTSALVMLA